MNKTTKTERGRKMKPKRKYIVYLLAANDNFEYPEPLSDELKEQAVKMEYWSSRDDYGWVGAYVSDMVMAFNEQGYRL